ncbi:MAG TPA: Rieske 2Fe-2S domain-containing protein [Chloroflexota bacterium]
MSGNEPFDEAIERILADESPRAEVSRLPDEEQRMLRMAQLLRGTQQQPMDPEFAEQLHERIFAGGRKVSRRTAFLSGLGALAAGLVGGVGIGRAVNSSSDRGPSSALPIVGKNGRWKPVAQVVDVPHGAIRQFSAGAVQGFVIHDSSGLRAVSRACTHMGCAINFSSQQQHFVCPCHGAQFDMRGSYIHSNQRDLYPEGLPNLPPVRVRVNGSSIEVWTV